MNIAVWDTYVMKSDGTIMHFDILAPSEITDTTIIYSYGEEYLRSKGIFDQVLSSKECRFCHMRAIQPQWKEDIDQRGYFILEMENCH